MRNGINKLLLILQNQEISARVECKNITNAIRKVQKGFMFINILMKDYNIILTSIDSVDMMEWIGVSKRKWLLKPEVKKVCVNIVCVIEHI